MKCSVEISMYPLDVNLIEPITFFIKGLIRHTFISLENNVMSTQVFEDYDNVITVIQKEMKNSFCFSKRSYLI